MRKEIKKLILELCKNQKWNWKNHIELVVKWSKKLARQLNADEDVCETAAWLHDIKKLKGEKEEHHIRGAEEAWQILQRLKYPKKKIQQITYCILTHSSDKKYSPKTKEAKIVASADALAQFETFLLFTYYVYAIKKDSKEEGRQWLIRKYQKNWNKLMPEAKKIALPKYKMIKYMLK
jgi:uncharacterized protein